MPTITERAVRAWMVTRGFQSKMVRTSVGGVHVLSRGNGSRDKGTMVFLHGLGASSTQLVPLVMRMLPHFDRVALYDLPAHGFSDVPRPFDEHTMETGVREMLERTLTRPVTLFGNSMGGFIAIRFALARPDLVDRLVLCAPGGAAMTDDEIDGLREVFRIDGHQDAVAFIDRLFARRMRLRHLYALSVRKRMADEGLQGLLGSVREDTLLNPEQLAKLDRPALVLWGRQDDILPKSGLGFFQAHLPGAIVEEIDGFGHSPHIEAPDRVAARILEFLGRAES